MKTDKLISMLETAKDLGISNIEIKWEDGRDGESSLIDACASFHKLPGLRQDGPLKPPTYVLLIKRGK